MLINFKKEDIFVKIDYQATTIHNILEKDIKFSNKKLILDNSKPY